MQTIQYIQPQHHSKLGQAELLVVDEAAAIPLPLVKKMLGPYLVFLCSTVNGCAATPCCAMLGLLCPCTSPPLMCVRLATKYLRQGC